jgi:NAD(P)-dependent dehydrogenase (short-subunit alcohol dehydrogenase family)
MNRLEKKTALVTGAARGIGEAIARAFVAEGATVWATDIDEARGRTSAATIGARFLALDVRDEARWAEVIGKIGSLDILVNNAAISGFQDGPVPNDPENTSLEQWRAVHAVNLDGTFLGCKYAIRAMRARAAGSIINLSSRSGLIGVPGAAPYASSKAGVRNHSKSVAMYCAQQGLAIRCNSIHPALIETPMWDDMLGAPGPGRDERLAALAAAMPVKRAGTVEEVAAMAVYLASDESAFVTGSEFNIDGGILAGSAASPN